MFEESKWVRRSHQSRKDRQYNGKNCKIKSIGTTQKANYRATRTPHRCAVPVPTMLRIIPNAEVDTKFTAYDAFME